MLRREFAKALIASGVGVAAPSIAGESAAKDDDTLVLDDAQRLTIRPGDIVVLMTEHKISQDRADRIVARMKPYFHGNTVLVLSDGMKIGVIGPDA